MGNKLYVGNLPYSFRDEDMQQAFSAFGSSMTMVFSTFSIVAAFACSTLIGVAFGFLPARNAAQLDPVEALSRE